MRKLFESGDDLLFLDARPGDAGLAVTFSFFEDDDEPAREGGMPSPFGQKVVRSLGLAGLYFVAKRPTWCQSPDRERLLDAAREAAAPFPRRIAYGLSKGGYSALAFGAAIGCGRIVAVSPQTTVSAPGAPLKPAWAKAIAQRPVIRDCVAEDLGDVVPEVIYDPMSRSDAWHVAHLRARHPVQEIRFPFATHKLLLTLRQCGLLRQATEAWLTDAAGHAGIRREFRRRRRGSAQYLHALRHGLLRRGHAAWADGCTAELERLAAAPA